MDDLQFNASLDALLANETLDTGQRAGSSNGSMESLSYPTSSQHLQPQQQLYTGAAESFSGSYNNSLNTGISPSNVISYGNVGYGQQQQQQQQQQHLHGGHAVGTAVGTAVSNAMVSVAPESGNQYLSLENFLAQDERRRDSLANYASDQRLSGTKRSRGGSSKGSTAAVSEDEEERFRRRQDRNLREQQRSQKITQQIDHLRSVLSSAQIRYKPDKFSTLVTVGEYIKQLQERSAMLDAEHKKLIDTITKANQLANEPHLPISSGGSTNFSQNHSTYPDAMSSSSIHSATGAPKNIYNEDEIEFVRNVDYKTIFVRCGIPLAVASIDGRFLDCNLEFEKMTGYKREEMLPSGPEPASETRSSSGGLSSLSSSSSDANATPPVTSDCSQQTTAAFEKKRDTIDTSNVSSSRNLSLFNLLSRECMERVFLALSGILKHPTRDDNDVEDENTPKDYWSGDVRLNRKSDMEMRLSVVLVRNSDGKAKFFNCYLAPNMREADFR
ncbi:PAS domain S-box containing protein [Nitzschia inconspicua]|uniref:PAS domain S-box containing protein n=1 Tax=Nitzschia inconspicua TaxID=303405 RepID=A0A9K3PGL4_9STRA|nr:PAS domain S-box containing protein [Nitzschia inconspicua]